MVTIAQAKHLANILTYQDLATLPKPAWLIDKYFPSKGVAWLIGKTGVYKTYLAASIACSVASTDDWAGLGTKHGRVIYIAAEDIEGCAPKFQAWGRYYNRTDADMSNLLVYNQALNLGSETEAGIFAEAMKSRYGAEDFKLIVIDTLAQCSPGVNENSKHEMDAVVKNLDLLWNTFNCLVLVIHHMGATTERIRGSTVMDGYSYGTLKVEVVDERVSVSDGKRRYGAAQSALYLDKVDVPMGYLGDDGQEVIEIVLTRAQNQIQHIPGVLTKRQKEALLTIYEAQDHSMQQSGLQSLMSITKANMHNIISPIVKSGYLSSFMEGRYAVLSVTSKGETLLADNGFIEGSNKLDLEELSSYLGLSNNGSSP